MEELPAGLVTFLFTDIEGSTRLHQRLGPRFADVISRHDDVLSRVFSGAGGRIVTHLGDGLFVAFASTADAVLAAVEAQAALESVAWPDGAELRVRMGLHCGDATPVAGNYVSLAVHQAARVSAAAHGGQVLITEECRRRLGDAVAVELRRLGDFRLKDFDRVESLWQVTGSGRSRAFAAPRVPPASGHNLRLGRTSFVGRDAETRQLSEALRLHPLVTILGPGGVGKSRLAARVAAESMGGFVDGVRAATLVAAEDGTAVFLAIADALGVPAGPDPAASIREWLRSRDLLLLIDNCEHIASAVASLVDDILESCPGVRVLATSREPLRVAGEHRWRIAPLPVPPPGMSDAALLEYDSVQLFLQRAESAHPGSAPVSSQLADAAEICRLLDGLPLGLELAAARFGALTLPELARRLRNREGIGGAPAHLAVAHHRSIHAVVEWSVQLLTGEQRDALLALSLLPAGFTVECGSHVVRAAGVDGDGGDLLGALWEASLLQRAADDRFAMLETIRQYCQAVVGAEQLQVVREATLDWAVVSTAEIGALNDAGEADRWNILVGVEHDNWISIAHWASAGGPIAPARRLLENLFDHFADHGHHVEGIGVLAPLIERLDPADRGRAALLSDIGGLACIAGDVVLATRSLDAALPLLRATGDTTRLISVLIRRGMTLTDAADYDSSDILIREALALARVGGDDRAIGRALINLGVNSHHRGDFGGAVDLNAAAIDHFNRVRWWNPVGRAENNIGEACEALGDVNEATRHFETARKLGELVGDPLLLSVSTGHLARIALEAGDARRAQSLAELAVRAAVDFGARDVIDAARDLLHRAVTAV